MRRISWLPLLLIACSGGPPPSTPQPRPDPKQTAQPAAFVDQMLAALERDDQTAWWSLLSKHMQERYGNPIAAHEQLSAWRRDVLPIAPTLRHATIALETAGPHPIVTYAAEGMAPEVLATVVLEGGVLHLDEN